MASSESVLHLRVDVDTVAGLRRGVPRLLELFARHDAAATFFVPMGPDRLVQSALFHRLRRRGFTSQVAQMNPVKVYGMPYLLKGLCGLNGHLGVGHPGELREIRRRGHEVALHGWDHAWWSDYLMASTVDEISSEIRRAIRAYEDIFGERPRGFGAPAWRCCRASLEALDSEGFRYVSELEGREPSLLECNGYTSRTLNIPVLGPTLFELMHGNGGNRARTVEEVIKQLRPASYNLLVLHAEYDVVILEDVVDAILRRARGEGYAARSIASDLDQFTGGPRAVYKVEYKERRGAVGPTAFQSDRPIAPVEGK